MADEIKVYDWDDEIENDGEDKEFVTLEEGDYEFSVHSFERGQYTPKEGAKTPACNMAIIMLKISTDEGDCYVRDTFPLASTMEWKASAFHRAVGLKKHGERLKMQWNNSIGLTGRAHITKTQGNKQDRWFNNVERYYDPKNESEDSSWD